LPANTSGNPAAPLTVPLTGAPETDTDLARVVATWPDLPAPIRRAVLALIESAAR
jgi:hypothetical protein